MPQPTSPASVRITQYCPFCQRLLMPMAQPLANWIGREIGRGRESLILIPLTATPLPRRASVPACSAGTSGDACATTRHGGPGETVALLRSPHAELVAHLHRRPLRPVDLHHLLAVYLSPLLVLQPQ